MITANYFDGQSARLAPVELEAADGALRVTGEAITRAYAYAQVKMAEPFAHAPAMLYFADGAHCEVADRAGAARLADALGYRKGLVARWQQHWYAALLALVLLLACGGAFMVWGVPALAERIAAAIPPSLDARIGASAQEGIEKKLLAPSRLSDERIAEIEDVLRSIAPANPRQPLRLLVRSAPRLGPNALALPNGTLVITDAMVLLILGKEQAFDDVRRAQLAGVLAHEIGHVQGRHSVRVMARSSLTAAASATMFGDFSAVAAGVPAVLMNMHYSREMETEADLFAMRLLAQHGMPTAPLADLFEALDEAHHANPNANMPRWLAENLSYVSSHPDSAERSERMRGPAPR
jgi:Zn-dependent protease with chaperone function